MKLVEVMACVDRVAKNGNNTAQHYSYAMASDVYEAVRGELAQRFVIPIPNMLKADFIDKPTKAGGSMTYCTATVRYDFTDAESGEVMSSTIIGAGSDSGDKSVYKALTGATKACLVNTFLIPTGDDPENEKAPRQSPPPPAGLEAVKSKMPPPPGAPAAKHDRALIYPFGRDKGKPISEVDDKSIAYWIAACQKDLLDPAQAKWHESVTRKLQTLHAEQFYRQRAANPSAPLQSGPRDDEPPPPDDNDAPPF